MQVLSSNLETRLQVQATLTLGNLYFSFAIKIVVTLDKVLCISIQKLLAVVDVWAESCLHRIRMNVTGRGVLENETCTTALSSEHFRS